MTEWLETDGLGGFAMGTADGIRTRRYHALLLAATRPPDGRMVLVADLEVFVETAAGRFALSSHRYRGDTVYPDGADRVTAFTHEPWPRWEWTLPDGTHVAHELAIEHISSRASAGPGGGGAVPLVGPPRVALRWTQISGAITSLHVRPLVAGRDYHATHHENPAFRFEPELHGDSVTWRPYPGVPGIHCAANALYQHAPDWYRAFHLADEAERGLDALEDLASPGVFTFDFSSGHAAMILSTAPGAGDSAAVDPATLGAAAFDPAVIGTATEAGAGDAVAVAAGIFTREARRRAALRALHPSARAADAYIVVSTSEPTPTPGSTSWVDGPLFNASSHGRTVIAGYPWFADWGRDTFIALRGLCLATGRRDDARAILCRWAGAVSAGMLPNRFDENDTTPEYNSVDAALWFIIAADAYLAGDRGDVAPADRALLRGAITAIVTAYQAGTRHAIRADSDGLLACGEPGTQLTWMDAKVAGICITPRIGKPVEIQALWINALHIAGRTADADRARSAFRRFWDPGRRQLHDVIDVDHVPGTVDATCRPNQLLAIGGVPHPVVAGDLARAVVDIVERTLWTPAGPRSLDPGDPRYHPRYLGGPDQRDRSYHNGPVWPWLAGPFIEAWVRVRGNTPDARRSARSRFLAPLLARAQLAGLGHLPEICDGDPPHRAVGAPFQAWSLAEALRLDQLLG